MFIERYEKLKAENTKNQILRDDLQERIQNLTEEVDNDTKVLTNLTQAVALLIKLKDDSLLSTYKFLEKSINDALRQIYPTTRREIKIEEKVRSNTHPQLEFQLITDGGTVQSVTDSGHGLSQIISLLSTLCLIAITGERKLVLLDEVLSGVSANGRKIIDDILHSFTQIGFQFVIIEHDFIPSNSKVYELGIERGNSKLLNVYKNTDGYYGYDYKD